MNNGALNTDAKDLSKREYAMLEKIFGADIEAALSKSPRVFQTNSTKVIHALRDKGMVRETEERLGGRFPVTIKGWELTALGHMTYCMSCDE